MNQRCKDIGMMTCALPLPILIVDFSSLPFPLLIIDFSSSVMGPMTDMVYPYVPQTIDQPEHVTHSDQPQTREP